MKRTIAILLLLLAWPATAAELSGSATAEVGETVWIEVIGEPVFQSDKTVAENLDVFRAWLGTTRFQVSSPDNTSPTLEPDVQIRFSFTDSALVWDLKAKFVAPQPGVYVVAALLADELTLHRIQVGPITPPGPTPPDPPNPPQPGAAPWPSPGLSVLILRESQTTGQLPVAQREIFTSNRVHQWLTAHCISLSDGRPGYRIWDDDGADVSGAPQVMQDAWKAVKAKAANDTPTIGISNGRTGYIGPLPGTVDDLLKLLEAYK